MSWLEELEADALSIKFLHKSGYNPMAVYSSLERAYEILDKDSAKKGFLSDFFSSHPVSEVRLNEARELANTFED